MALEGWPLSLISPQSDSKKSLTNRIWIMIKERYIASAQWITTPKLNQTLKSNIMSSLHFILVTSGCYLLKKTCD